MSIKVVVELRVKSGVCIAGILSDIGQRFHVGLIPYDTDSQVSGKGWSASVEIEQGVAVSRFGCSSKLYFDDSKAACAISQLLDDLSERDALLRQARDIICRAGPIGGSVESPEGMQWALDARSVAARIAEIVGAE